MRGFPFLASVYIIYLSHQLFGIVTCTKIFSPIFLSQVVKVYEHRHPMAAINFREYTYVCVSGLIEFSLDCSLCGLKLAAPDSLFAARERDS